MEFNAIEIKNLTKKISGNIILDNISLKVEEGKIYGIIGKNGSGKSMLIKAISGLLVPSSGTIKVFEKEIIKGELPNNIGVLFDSIGLLEQYSSLENLKILASINNKINDNVIKELLLYVGLNPEDKRAVKKYSLGMKQKLGIVQAIMEDPDLILLDEPMNGLDEQSVNIIRELILDLKKRGKTILLTSHNNEDISILCDYVYKMDFGKLKIV